MAQQELYFVECDFGKIGTAFIETDPFKNSLAGVVEDIATGQVEDVIRVLEVIPDEKSCRDVTEDVARRVSDYLENKGEGCPDWLRNWIDEHVDAGEADRLDYKAGGWGDAA